MVGLFLASAGFYCFRQEEGGRLMGALIDELQRREAAARAEAEELRGRIAELAERLAGVEERLSRLVITREMVDEVLSGADADVPSAGPEVTAGPGAGHSPLVGVLAVPPWRAWHGHRTLRPRPRATAKWLAGSVEHDRVLAVPPRPRAPAALPRHSARPAPAPRLTPASRPAHPAALTPGGAGQGAHAAGPRVPTSSPRAGALTAGSCGPPRRAGRP